MWNQAYETYPHKIQIIFQHDKHESTMLFKKVIKKSAVLNDNVPTISNSAKLEDVQHLK